MIEEATKDGCLSINAYFSLLKSMNLLYPCCYAFFCIFKSEGRVPFGAGLDFNSPEFLVFLLEFQYYLKRIPHHLALAKNNFWNLSDFLIGIGRQL